MIAARLERLPFSRFHARLLLIGGLGYMFDAMDVAIVAFVMPSLRLWDLSSAQVGLLAASTAIGGLVGALFAGRLADRFGRRNLMMWALAIYCVATLAGAFATDWRWFLVSRIIAGVGTSAESAVIAPFLAEFAGARFRGRYTGALTGFFSFGYVAAALLGLAVPAMGEHGWRIALIITAAPIIMLLWWRRTLPESPRWLVSQGRGAEAERIVAAVETEVAVRHGPLAPVVSIAEAPTAPMERGFLVLLRPDRRRATLVALAAWFSIGFTFYAYFTWIPSLLVESGRSVQKSFAFSLMIYAAQAPGYFSAAWLNDLIGRRAVVGLYLALAAVAAAAMAFAVSDLQVILAAISLSLLMNGAYAGLYAYTPEIFPTGVRATAQGVAIAVSRVGAIISPIMVGFLYPLGGFAAVFGVSTAILAFGAITIGMFGLSTKGRALEAIG